MGSAARPVVNALDRELAARLDALQAQGLRRELRRVDSAPGPRLMLDGHSLLNFSSNDYLGLAAHPALKEAAIRATEKFGTGSGASRLICGSLAPHHELEAALADFKGTAAALSFSTGYAAAVGTIGALLGKDDVVILDKLVHACIVDAAKLSGATIRVFRHNDLDRLEDHLRWATVRSGKTLVVTESIFSMDGDRAPLREIVELKDRHGAWLMVDEAHATGMFGARRRGLAEELGVSERIEIQMGTLGKALGAAGGYIAGSRVLVDFLVNRARSFIFSTAPVPAQSAAAKAAVELVQSLEGAELCNRLWERVAQAQPDVAHNVGQASRLSPTSIPCLPAKWGPATDEEIGAEPLSDDVRDRRDACPTPSSAILPLLLGDESLALAMAAELCQRGLFVPAIRYPTVARGQARLRITLSAAHSADDVATLAAALAGIHNPQSAIHNDQACPA
jgi:8-amino-7-oxononanoate synthase